MPQTVFDLREHPNCGLVRIANENLASERPEYIDRFGQIGSPRWWQHYDAGHISRTEYVGEITHIGPSVDEFDERCDIVRIRTDRRDIEYDREGFWLDSEITIGRWLHIERVQAIVQTGTGPITSIIDVRIWLEDAS